MGNNSGKRNTNTKGPNRNGNTQWGRRKQNENNELETKQENKMPEMKGDVNGE